MPEAPEFVRPDVLVLGAGGILGEAWLTGVLAGIEDASSLDLTETKAFVGTSAGSIVSANLAAGRRPRRPRETRSTSTGASPSATANGRGDGAASRTPGGRWATPSSLGRWATAVAAPLSALAPMALAAGGRPGAALRAAVLSRVPTGRRSLGELRHQMATVGARFDGRLRVVVVDRSTGRRVVFGAPGSPPADVADAVAASCAIPGVFSPVTIGGRSYVDGGVWSLNNLDAAPVDKRGANVLCLTPTGGIHLDVRSPFAALRTAVHASLAVEALALRRRGARVRTVAPDTHSASLMALNLMDPGPSQRVLAAGFAQGRRMAGA